MKHTIATIISRVFDPFVAITILLILAIGRSSLTMSEQIRGLFVGLVVIIGVPVGLFIWAIRTKLAENWDVSKREERPKLFFLIFFYELLVLLFLRPTLDQFLYQTLITFICAFAGFTFVTLFWKISGHAFINAFVTGHIVTWFGWVWWPVLFVVPLVSWSRVVRGNHTVLQVVLGALYGWMVVMFASFL